eukprot:3583720-Rhodomonas_salina.7
MDGPGPHRPAIPPTLTWSTMTPKWQRFRNVRVVKEGGDEEEGGEGNGLVESRQEHSLPVPAAASAIMSGVGRPRAASARVKRQRTCATWRRRSSSSGPG